MYPHQPYGGPLPQRLSSTPVRQPGTPSFIRGSFDEHKQTQTIIDGYFEPSSSKSGAAPRPLNFTLQQKHNTSPVQSEYFQNDVNMETEFSSAPPIVPQSGSGDPSWSSMDMTVDEPDNVPVLLQNQHAPNPSFANSSPRWTLPPFTAKAPQGNIDHKGQPSPMWRANLRQQQAKTKPQTAVGYHPYAQTPPGVPMTREPTFSITPLKQQQGTIATKKSNAVRGIVQNSTDSKTRGARESDDPTLIHPGGIRMQTIQYLGSIQQFLGGSVVPPTGVGKAVLVEVIGTLVAEPSRSDYCWTYSLRDPMQHDFANSFPKVRELFFQPQFVLAGSSKTDLRCHYYDIDKVQDLDLMDPGQIIRAIGVVSSRPLDSTGGQSLQLVTIRRATEAEARFTVLGQPRTIYRGSN